MTHENLCGLDAIFQEYGAFYAYSPEQVAGRAQPGEEYVKREGSMYVPKRHLKAVTDALDAAKKMAADQDMAKHAKDEIILRELLNNDCFYHSDLTQCINSLQIYGYTAEDVEAVFIREYDAQQN